MNIRDMASQVQMRQAQTQHFQAQAAQMQAEAAQNQRLLAGRNKLDALMTSDPKIAEAVGKGDWGAVQGQGIPFEVLNAAQEGHAKVVSQLATTDTATLNNKLTRNKILGNGLESMTDPSTSESDIPGLANSWIQQSASNGLFKDIDQSLVPKEGSINTRADVNKAAATLGLFHGMTQAALELQESRAKANEATSKARIAAGQAAGQTPAGLLPPEIAPAAKAQADAEHQQMINNLMKQAQADPSKGEALIDTAFPTSLDPAVNKSFHSSYQAAMATDPTKAPAVVQAAAEQAAAYSKSSNPTILAGEIKKAQAMAPVVINHYAAEQSIRQNSGKLTPEAADMAAEMYAKTGTLPALGMGSTPIRRQIIERAAELHPHIDLATNASAYAANKASLVAVQKNADSVQSFERAAGKNLDLLVSEGQKVIDSGSPWINKPLREVAQGALGNTEVPAYNAARQVAINEIAKVTNNGGSMAGPLSDTARKEVENFNPANATFAQTVNVARVLRADMENRMGGYHEQIQDISRRIGTQTQQPAAGQAAPAATPPQPTDLKSLSTDELMRRLAGGNR
jgi:hypothetical protein